MSNKSWEEKNDKNEKQDEKEVQKRDEKTVEEKYRNDPPSTFTWAAILIWAGLVLLASNLGWLANLPVKNLPGNWQNASAQTWAVIFLGAGVILLFNVLVRVLVPAYRHPVGGTLVLVAIFFGIGLGSIFGWEVVWPLVLIAIGLSFLLRGAFHHK